MRQDASDVSCLSAGAQNSGYCKEENIMTETAESIFLGDRLCSAWEAAECFRGKEVNDLSDRFGISIYAARVREAEGYGDVYVFVAGTQSLRDAYIIIDPDVLAGLRENPKAMRRASEMISSKCENIKRLPCYERPTLYGHLNVASALEGGRLPDFFRRRFGKDNSDFIRI